MEADGRGQNQVWMSGRVGVEAWTSVWAARFQCRHAHDSYQVCLGQAGAGRFVSRTEDQLCDPGRFVLIRPGEVHEVHPVGTGVWRFDTLYIAPDVVKEFIRFSPEHPSRGTDLNRPVGSGDTLASDFASLHRCVTDGASAVEQESRLARLLARLSGKTAASRDGAHIPSPGTPGLRRVRDYLESLPERNVTLTELAELAGLSPFHLTRAFRREYGLPPHAYLIQVRVNRARAILRQGVPAAQVAARTGFADQAHLTRQFKRLVGVTPGDYVRGARSFKIAMSAPPMLTTRSGRSPAH